MKWYDAVRDFLYVHPWLQGLIFGSLIAIAGGGSFLHRRKERKHARDLVVANQQANTYREEANRLSAELLKVHTAQAETANLIGQALNQQGKVLDEQTKIMAKQFELQRRIETKAEKDNVFNLVFEVHVHLAELATKLSALQRLSPRDRNVVELPGMFQALMHQGHLCHKALLFAIHLSGDEKKDLLDYIGGVMGLQYTGNLEDDFQRVNDVYKNKSKDFYIKMGKFAQIPEVDAS